MKSRVHPKYKTKYHVGNWPEYERALVRRGDITLWLSADAIDAWTPRPSGRRGGQRKFSDQAIETALTLRLVFGLPLRQAEGFLRSVLSVMRVDLDTPESHHALAAEPAPGDRVSPRSGYLRTLVTASPSDRPSQSLLLCHGLGSASSRRSPCGLRHRGPAPPSEDLPLVPPPLCDLSGVRPRPRLLRGALPDPGPPPLGAGRQGPPSTQSGRAPRSPGPSTRLSRPVPREGSHFPRRLPVRQTPRP